MYVCGSAVLWSESRLLVFVVLCNVSGSRWNSCIKVKQWLFLKAPGRVFFQRAAAVFDFSLHLQNIYIGHPFHREHRLHQLNLHLLLHCIQHQLLLHRHFIQHSSSTSSIQINFNQHHHHHVHHRPTYITYINFIYMTYLYLHHEHSLQVLRGY